MLDDLPLLEIERWLNAPLRWRGEMLDDVIDAFELRLDHGANQMTLRRNLTAHAGELRFFSSISERMYGELLRAIAWECVR
jgi:hypothetical protein